MKKYFMVLTIIYTSGCNSSIKLLSEQNLQVKYNIVINNAGLFDGENDRGIVNIGINADTIAAITTFKIEGESEIDGTGKYVIPGLVNAHVHTTTLKDLQAGYPLGILTILNMHTGLEDRELEWKIISKDSVGLSTLFGSGHAATVPGGHPNQFSPNMETINDSVSIEEWIDQRIAKKVDYIKVVREHHEWMGHPPVPTLDYEQIHKIIDYAHSKGYKVVVHANTVEEMMKIASFKPDGFVHMLDYKEDYPAPDSYYQALAKSGAFIIPTGGIALKPKDGAPPFVREWVTQNLLDAKERADIIKKYHHNGILLVAGTDAQQGQMNFAEDYYYELELYKLAGLSNIEILKTATGNAAKAFSLPIGLLNKGSKANMVLLTASPIEDINNLKKVEQVWKNGKIN